MKKKKNVLLIVRWPVGGIRTFFRYVYRNFNTDCWRFTLLAPDLPETRILKDDLVGLDISYVLLEENPSTVLFALKIIDILINNKFDLIHSHGFTAGLCATFPAKIFHTKHLMTSHDIINVNMFYGLTGKVKKKIMEILFNMVDSIQSVSYDAENNLFEYFPALANKKTKCVVITNGIEVQRFIEARPRDFRNELGLGENFFLIGFLGRFMSQKGFRYLVDAIEILRSDSSLPKNPIILTFGDGGFFREEKEAIVEKGLESYFRFMPFTPNVASTIKGLDVVVMPSLWEACPLQPMEVLVSGTPFIGTDCYGLREVLLGTPAQIIQKANSLALANAIKHEMIVCRKNIFFDFIDQAIKRFDVKKQSLDLLNLYENI